MKGARDHINSKQKKLLQPKKKTNEKKIGEKKPLYTKRTLQRSIVAGSEKNGKLCVR